MNLSWFNGNNSGVRFVRTILIVLLALFWVLATNHCRIETIPGLDFLVCCSHDKASPHQDNDCETDGCAQVESGLYKMENNPVSVATPTFLLANFLTPLLEELAAPETASDVLIEAAPPELSKVWQFTSRTALPPRAPSIAS